MKKQLLTFLCAFLFSGSATYSATVRIEDSATSTTGLCSYDGVLKAYSGASNGYAINLTNASAKGITWKVLVSSAGTYTLTWRYVNGSSSAATNAKLIINGTTVNSALPFPKTSDKSTFTTTSTTATFVSGVNQIRIETSSSSEFADIDWIEVAGNVTSASDCSAAIGSGGGTTVSVTGVTVSPTSSTITTSGGTVQLVATIAPSNATNQTVSWSSSSTSVATVSSTGLVTAVANGTATITVTTADGGKTSTSAITVNISSTPTPSTDMIGYATVSGEGYTTTTGGAGGATKTISTLADLQTWVTSRENNTTPEIVYINAKITSSSSIVLTIKHGSNISIYGVGTAGELQNIGLNIRDYQNVIVRNMKVHEVLYPNDAITIDECLHVWVDHCELYSKIGSGITVDTYDGLLDIKNGSRYVTVSWCYLHHHMKCMLYGHTDNSGQQATDSQMRITFHHNWVSYTDGRNPSLRFGAVHMFNNYFEEISDYGIAARDGGHAKLENNHYNNVVLPMSTDKFPVSGLPNGYICESGTLLTGTTGAKVISQTGCDFWTTSVLPYSYSLDATSNVASIVKANCGVGKVSDLKSAPLADKGINSKPSMKIEVYPNPVTSSANVSFVLGTSSNVQIKIFNAVGKQVAVVADQAFDAGYNEVTYNNQGLNAGMYILTIKSNSEEEKIKIMVE